MKRSRFFLPFLVLAAAACEQDETPLAPEPVPAVVAAAPTQPPAPAPTVTPTVAGTSRTLWPFTSEGVAGTPQDPVNLIFAGDGRAVRGALLALDGDRTAFGFPASPPFDCRWTDAIGANQTAWSEASGWTGSTLQLECGDFGPIRFHVRLFPAGAWTLGNAHFEVLIAGTNQHQVLSWELAERLVMVDMVRSGALGAAPGVTAAINPSPYRSIPPFIYNGLPAGLRVLAGGPAGNVAAPVPLVTDGRATTLVLGNGPGGDAGVFRQEFVLAFDQTLPKPFCASGPFDFIHVEGPIDFRHQVVVTNSDNVVSHFHARGRLTVTPIDPSTGQPAGESYTALVGEHYRNVHTDAVTLVSNLRIQTLLPRRAPWGGRLHADLRVAPGGATSSSITVDCG